MTVNRGDQIIDAANLNQDGAYILEINGTLVPVVLGRKLASPKGKAAQVSSSRRAQLDDGPFVFADDEHNLYRVYIEPDGSFVVYRNTEWDSTAVKIFEEAVEHNMIKGGRRRRSKKRSTRRRRCRRSRRHH